MVIQLKNYLFDFIFKLWLSIEDLQWLDHVFFHSVESKWPFLGSLFIICYSLSHKSKIGTQNKLNNEKYHL